MGLRNPDLKTSLTISSAVTDHRANWREARTVSARAAAQTAPRQKRSLLRKTARAMKPAK